MNMKKSEVEPAIRYLCHQWRKDRGFEAVPNDQLSFSDFYLWLETNHSPYLRFRTTTSVRYDIEMWFDQVFGQAWRR